MTIEIKREVINNYDNPSVKEKDKMKITFKRIFRFMKKDGHRVENELMMIQRLQGVQV